MCWNRSEMSAWLFFSLITSDYLRINTTTVSSVILAYFWLKNPFVHAKHFGNTNIQVFHILFISLWVLCTISTIRSSCLVWKKILAVYFFKSIIFYLGYDSHLLWVVEKLCHPFPSILLFQIIQCIVYAFMRLTTYTINCKITFKFLGNLWIYSNKVGSTVPALW